MSSFFRRLYLGLISPPIVAKEHDVLRIGLLGASKIAYVAFPA